MCTVLGTSFHLNILQILFVPTRHYATKRTSTSGTLPFGIIHSQQQTIDASRTSGLQGNLIVNIISMISISLISTVTNFFITKVLCKTVQRESLRSWHLQTLLTFPFLA